MICGDQVYDIPGIYVAGLDDEEAKSQRVAVKSEGGAT